MTTCLGRFEIQSELSSRNRLDLQGDGPKANQVVALKTQSLSRSRAR